MSAIPNLRSCQSWPELLFEMSGSPECSYPCKPQNLCFLRAIYSVSLQRVSQNYASCPKRLCLVRPLSAHVEVDRQLHSTWRCNLQPARLACEVASCKFSGMQRDYSESFVLSPGMSSLRCTYCLPELKESIVPEWTSLALEVPFVASLYLLP